MKLSSSKTRGIVFSGETNVLYYTYKLWDPSNICTDTITDLGVNSIQNCISTHTCGLYFLLISKDARLNTNYNLFVFYSYSLLISYLKLDRSKPEYASTVY